MTEERCVNLELRREILYSLMLEAKREEALQLLLDHAGAHGFQSAVNALLEPVLEKAGEAWHRENLSLAQGYVAGKIAEDLLVAAAESGGDLPLDVKGPVVIGNVEDDYHSLGRKMVAVFLRAAGWKVVDLGNDVVPGDFVDAALANGARVIGVSAMMLTTAENIRALRSEIDARGLGGRIQLAVGGAVFKLRPELMLEVGGDGTATSAIQAPELFERLWAHSLAEDK
ncbi:B12 binding domain-containing protein [Desulfomicrobium apsheronum]|uniref:B12 binding domain-containing protein n=1 Tax=Desulfomicrobium apsheronum TaxID=52560 RepID=A0A1I3PYX1_9BACT|nr:cobalamin-dependent protein [Desulfomicrobium apsheronum]MDY0225455.1 cobalamin-dependent protein [Desulfomicrobium apsheronum]SFJ27064.1 B12 binding domain-containing protein [Desulfomicrobium apsheronum]